MQAGGQVQLQAQPVGQQQQAAQPAHINVNESLKGNPPTPFDGTRSKSSGFLVAFNFFRAANCHNEAMANPYSCVTTALTYMTGDIMEPWKEDQLNLLNDRINAGYQDNDEQLWNFFEADFRQAFTNTHKAKDMQRELKTLNQKDNLDTYISEFKRLARDSGYPLNNIGTIERFKRGLKKGLFDTIIDLGFREGVSDRAKRGSDALCSSAKSVEFRLRNSGRGGCLFPTQSFDFIYVSSVSWNSD